MANLTSAYVAGFFDGEGSLGIYGENAESFVIQLDSTCEYIVHFLAYKYGGTVSVSHQSTATTQTSYKWRIRDTHQAVKFLLTVMPYLRLKQDQAALMLRYLRTRRPGEQRRLPVGVVNYRRSLAERMRSAKRPATTTT